jgi:hypothetical protein
MFYDRATGKLELEFLAAESDVMRSLWHPKLNQIVVGLGSGDARVLYDPQKSRNGALLCVHKPAKKSKSVSRRLGLNNNCSIQSTICIIHI